MVGTIAEDMTRVDTPAARSWTGHPLWLVGFRPFFLLACLAGVAGPLTWVLMLSGALSPPPGVSPVQWHAHEMFFGFGFAVLGGFLLTATKNWVKVRGVYGRPLQALAAAWVLERLAMALGGSWPAPLRLAALHLFGVGLVALVLRTLVASRRTDSYRDNPIFWVALPLFVAARLLLLSPEHFAEGRDFTLALFRLMFLVMLERTVPQFMKAAFQQELPRVPAVDAAIKALGVLLLATPWLPARLRGACELLLAVLVVGRFISWRPHLAFGRIELGVMYAGGLALAAQLALHALGGSWVGALPLHVFTFGTMGLIIPSMLLRIARGHTGRPVRFEPLDRAALWVMVLAFSARVVLPQLFPAHYQAWLWVAAGCWSFTFALVGVRIAPALLAERVDGKEH